MFISCVEDKVNVFACGLVDEEKERIKCERSDLIFIYIIIKLTMLKINYEIFKLTYNGNFSTHQNYVKKDL